VKVGVCCAASTSRIVVGPVFLGQFFPQLTEEECVAGFSKTQLLPTLQRMSMQALPDVFGDRIISNGVWPARSPDLDFFFWVCLKDKVNNSNP
jgi:hypothetical protein